MPHTSTREIDRCRTREEIECGMPPVFINDDAQVMLTFDDFVIGMEQFGTRIQPLMRSRATLPIAA